MARYSSEFKERAVARLLPPESAEVSRMSQEIGVSVATLERWRADALSRPARERAWTAAARLEAVIATAAMDEAQRSTWCRDKGVFPSDLAQWRESAMAALAQPEEARATAQETRADRRRIKVSVPPATGWRGSPACRNRLVHEAPEKRELGA